MKAVPSMTKAGYRPESVENGPDKPRKSPENKGKKKRGRKRRKTNPASVVSVIVFLIAVAIAIGTLYIFKTVENGAEVYAVGQMLRGHPLGGMSTQEASALLEKLTGEKVAAWRYDVACLGHTYSLSAEDVGLYVDEHATLDPLWQVGKTGGMVERFVQLAEAFTLRENVQPVLRYTMEPVDALLARIVEETNCTPVDATIRYVPANSVPFRFTDDQVGYEVDPSALRTQIEEAILALTPGSVTLEPRMLRPAVTREALENATVLRARVTMRLDEDEGALTNVKIAAGMLNGMRVEAGETFSFNQLVGKRTAEGGYLPAAEPAYGGQTVGIGGGVCQLSTALYRAALMACLPIKSRSAAVSPLAYCEMGQEAVVSDQGLDLEFVNDTQTPLFVTTRIYADESGSVLDVQLIGEPTDARYEIVTRATTIDAPKEPVYVRDSEGTYATYMDERVAVGTGMPGYGVVVERIAMDKNGAQLSCETISQHVYEPIAPTVYVGVQVR